MEYVQGVDKLLASLQSLKKTKAKAAIRKGARSGSKIIAAAAKRSAPKETGMLKGSIKVRALKRSRKWTGVTATQGIYYGSFLELGTKKIKARHWYQKVAKENGSRAQMDCLEVIKETILKDMKI